MRAGRRPGHRCLLLPLLGEREFGRWGVFAIYIFISVIDAQLAFVSFTKEEGMWDYGDRIINAMITKARRTQRSCRVRSAPTQTACAHAPGRAGRRPGRYPMVGCPVARLFR